VPVVGVTGGIASGKTTFAGLLASRVGAEVFDADREARRLVETDHQVLEEIRARFGEAVIKNDSVDRAALRALVFHDPDKRRDLEAILHPRIRAKWTETAAIARKAGTPRWLIVDIPLLFETQAETYMDETVVIACTPATQRARLEKRQLTPAIVEKIISAQMPAEEKVRRASRVIWNDGAPSHLEAQADILAALLLSCHE
jgi:dephospho-CoA kinase